MALTKATRVNLSLTSGYKVPDLDALRNYEPRSDVDYVILERAVVGGPLLNATMYFDKDDTTSPDDDCSIFVTQMGARWKADISHGYNAWLAGYSFSSNNIAQCINKVVGVIVAKVLSKGYLTSTPATIWVPSRGDNLTDTITETVKIPSFCNLRFTATTRWSCVNLASDKAIHISNEFPGLNGGMGNSFNGYSADQGSCVVDVDGKLYIEGQGFDGSDNPLVDCTGVYLGNATRQAGNAPWLNVRDSSVRNVHVFNFKGGLRFGEYDTYMVGFDSCNAYNNQHALYQPQRASGNSGERMWLRDCVLSNSKKHNMYINNIQDFFLYNCSNDYSREDLMHFGPDAACTVQVYGGHIEGMGGYLATQPTKNGTSGQIRVLIDGARIDTRRSGIDYRGCRELFFSQTYNDMYVELVNVDMPAGGQNYYCNSAYGSWAGAPGAGNNIALNMSLRNNDGFKWLPRYKYGDDGVLLNSLYDFTGPAGVALPLNRADAVANPLRSAYHWITKTGGATVVYGSEGDREDDQYTPIIITTTSESDVVQIFSAAYINFPRSTVKLSCMASVKVGSATTGNLKVTAVQRAVGQPTVTYSTPGGVPTVTQTETVLGVISGTSVEMNTIFGRAYISRTKDNFITTPPLKVSNYHLGSVYNNPGLSFTGVVGTFMVKLPAYWFDSIPTNT